MDATAIDLFSGCGGMTLGLKQAGFDVIGAIEIDDIAARTYELNHPEVELWQDDIRAIHPTEVMDQLSLNEFELDLLAGCPPCQGFSSMTTLNGKRRINDRRNNLVLRFLTYAEYLLPKAIMMENVPGLARDSRFTQLCNRLATLGYYINWDILNVADYGVPQRRRRLIFLASFIRPIQPAPGTGIRRTVRDAIGKLGPAGRTGDPLHDFPENRSERIRAHIARIRKDGGSRTELSRRDQLQCHRDCDGFKDIYGRMAWNAVAPTITSGCFNPSKGRFLHPKHDRAITMREAALLQSFPRGYRFVSEHGKTRVAEMIGNALPPEFVRIHAMAVQRALQK